MHNVLDSRDPGFIRVGGCLRACAHGRPEMEDVLFAQLASVAHSWNVKWKGNTARTGYETLFTSIASGLSASRPGKELPAKLAMSKPYAGLSLATHVTERASCGKPCVVSRAFS